MAIVLSYPTLNQLGRMQAAGYDSVYDEDLIALLEEDETIALRTRRGPVDLLVVKPAGIEVMVLGAWHDGQIADDREAVIVNRHLLPAGSGGAWVGDPEAFFGHLGEALGVGFLDPDLVWVDPEVELGEGWKLPDDWDRVVASWLEKQRAIIIGHVSAEEAARLPAGYERLPRDAVKRMVDESARDIPVGVWVDCDVTDLVRIAERGIGPAEFVKAVEDLVSVATIVGDARPPDWFQTMQLRTAVNEVKRQM